ncbi:hypothetical protein [Nocardia sp. NPDC057440]
MASSPSGLLVGMGADELGLAAGAAATLRGLGVTVSDGFEPTASLH